MLTCSKNISFPFSMQFIQTISRLAYFNKTMLSLTLLKWLTIGLNLRLRNTDYVSWNGPLISPDMNPIEHLWAELKRGLHRRYSDTLTLQEFREFIKATMRQRLQEVWWDIGADVLNKLIESMSERVKALWKAGGWYTEFWVTIERRMRTFDS